MNRNQETQGLGGSALDWGAYMRYGSRSKAYSQWIKDQTPPLIEGRRLKEPQGHFREQIKVVFSLYNLPSSLNDLSDI